jgi:RNA polymerase sigma factor (sigma-70 family)
MYRTVRSLSRTVRLPESAKNAHSRSVPLDEPSGEERLSLTDVLCENDALAPDDAAAREQIRGRAREHLSSLSAREELVLRRRFGIERAEAQTLREIGEELGITRERVRQIEKAALDKLRRRMRGLAE